jgi:hypothetical protein
MHKYATLISLLLAAANASPIAGRGSSTDCDCDKAPAGPDTSIKPISQPPSATAETCVQACKSDSKCRSCAFGLPPSKESPACLLFSVPAAHVPPQDVELHVFDSGCSGTPTEPPTHEKPRGPPPAEPKTEERPTPAPANGGEKPEDPIRLPKMKTKIVSGGKPPAPEKDDERPQPPKDDKPATGKPESGNPVPSQPEPGKPSGGKPETGKPIPSKPEEDCDDDDNKPSAPKSGQNPPTSKPAAGDNKPAPATDNQKPQPANEKPAASGGYSKPQTGNGNPAPGSDNKPSTGKPTTSDDKPAPGNIQPAPSSNNPSTGNDKPAGNNPSTGNDKPATGSKPENDKPAGNGQPATGNTQPSAGYSQPSTGNNKPSTGTSQPSTGGTASKSDADCDDDDDDNTKAKTYKRGASHVKPIKSRKDECSIVPRGPATAKPAPVRTHTAVKSLAECLALCKKNTSCQSCEFGRQKAGEGQKCLLFSVQVAALPPPPKGAELVCSNNGC